MYEITDRTTHNKEKQKVNMTSHHKTYNSKNDGVFF